MPQYQVVGDPGIPGVSIGDILQQPQEDVPYQDLNSPTIYIAADFVENNPDLFQLVS